MTSNTPLPQVSLILGGARSGKSRHAEQLVQGSGLAPIYLATAEPGDAEMAARIRLHRERRGPAWQTREAPLELPTAIRDEAAPDRAILVDCLTLWLSNLLGAGRDSETETALLIEALAAPAGPLVLVSNEVGQGIVPLGELSRRFVDAAGRLHQAVAARADRVVLMVAGLPLALKPGIETPPCTS